MSKIISSKSRQAELDAKLTKHRNATIAVEELLFGELANSPYRAAIKPDLNDFTLALRGLTEAYGFDCEELARILTTSAKLLPERKPVRDAANYLIVLKKQMPPDLQSPAGWVAIQNATRAGDTKFFRQLGETLDNMNRKPAKQMKREIFSEVRSWLSLWWHPDSRRNWPGLAYCTHPAQREFFDILMPRFSRGTNYFDNERRRMGLIHSSQCFVSSIKEIKGKLRLV